MVQRVRSEKLIGILHGIFHSADADWVGLTEKVPWENNRQWIQLLAKSGTPLFVSAQPSSAGPEQKSAIKECFALASRELPLGEPLDWMERVVPKKWKLMGKEAEFDWD
jgi:alpha-galactosidase